MHSVAKNCLSIADFAESVGAVVDSIDRRTVDFFNSHNWHYRILSGAERDAVLVDNLKFWDYDTQVVGHSSRAEIWQDGWQENLELYRQNHSPDDLIPKFIRSNNLVRFRQQYIYAEDQNFELNFVRVFQRWLFGTYIQPFENVYEFGCGSGFNLQCIDQIMSTNLYGCDFVQSSVDIINEMSNTFKSKLHGFRFDMNEPDCAYSIKDQSCVFTFGAIEQIPDGYHRFIDYLVEQRPSRCIHIEPVCELYDKNNLIDLVAMLFHKKRGYTTGLLPYLRKLNSDGKIRLVKVHKTCVGSLRIEGYNYIIWEPV